MKFDSAREIVSSLLSLLLIVYLFCFLLFVYKKLKTRNIGSEEDEVPYSILLVQSPNTKLQLNRFYTLYVTLLKFVCVLAVVFIKNNYKSLIGFFAFLCVLYIIHEFAQIIYHSMKFSEPYSASLHRLLISLIGMGILIYTIFP